MRRRARPQVSGRHEWIVGRNPVLEVLRANRRTVARIAIPHGLRPSGTVEEIVRLARARSIPVETGSNQDLEGDDASAHGVRAQVEPYPYLALDDLLAAADDRREDPLVLLLDEVQDPQNLGTLLRTAEAAGVHGVVLPYRRSAGITPAVVRSSSGASEHLRVAAENLAQAIERLKDRGVRVVGLEADPAAVSLERLDLTGPLALVVGSEAEGLRRLVRQGCDQTARLPLAGRVGSLNAAVAGSIALYLAWSARREMSPRIDAPPKS